MAISPKAQEMFDAYNNLDVRKKVKAYAKEVEMIDEEQDIIQSFAEAINDNEK